MPMPKTWKWRISLAVVLLLFLAVFLYNWDRVNSGKQIIVALHEEYPNVKFHQSRSTHYQLNGYYFEVPVVFDALPHFTYYFERKNRKVFLSGTGGGYNGTLPPDPVPHSTSWIPRNST